MQSKIEEKVKDYFFLSNPLGQKIANETTLYTISKVQWNELVEK